MTSRRILTDSAKAAILATVYLAAGKFGLQLAFIHRSASTVWPPTGIALAAILLGGFRLWPGIWLGAFLVNLTTAGTVLTSIGIATGNMLEAVIGAWLVERFANGRRAFERAADIFLFVLLAGILSTSLSATIGVTSLALGGIAPFDKFFPIWFTWWLGDAVSALLITPLIVVWSTTSMPRLSREKASEAGLVLAAACLITILGFGGAFPAETSRYSRFLIYPALLWASYRFGRRGAVSTVFLVTVVAIWGTVHGFGPFVSSNPNESLLLLQTFTITLLVTNLVLGAVVSERGRAEQEVVEKEAELKLITDTTPVMLTRCSRDLRYVFVNRAYAKMLGRSPDQIVGRPIMEIMGATGFEAIRPRVEKVLQGQPAEYEDEVHFAGIGSRWLQVTYMPDRNPEGNVVGWVASISDVTEHKQNQQALRESQARVAGLVDSAMDAIIAIDDTQRVVLFNPAAEKMFGCPSDKALGTSLDRFIPTGFRETHRKHIEQFGKTGVTNRRMGALGALDGQRANGEQFPIEASISQMEVGDEKLYTVIVRDISERKRAEEALRESEGRFRTMAESAPVMIWISGVDKLCTYFNKPWLQFTGRALQQEQGNGWVDGVHPEDLPRCLETYRTSFEVRREFQMEYRLQRHDGEFRWLLNHGVPRFTSRNEFIGYIGSCIDITERKLAEAELEAWRCELESRVEKRTLELALAHKQLQAEVEERKRLENEIARAVEREQLRLGQELHDGLGQQLTGIGYMMTALQIKLRKLSRTRAREAARLQRLIQQSVEQTRVLAKGFYPVELERHGLLVALLEITSRNDVHSEISYSVQSDGNPTAATLKGPLAIQLFRIAQEAAHNAAKHAKARNILIRLAKSNGDITLTVKDNGIGFPSDLDSSKGMGVRIMRHRARMIGGKLDFRNSPGGGGVVTCSVPFEKHLELQAPIQCAAADLTKSA